jgi:glycosyltransferase involved in cell wall biosynthesis
MPPPLVLQVTETARGGVGRHVRDLLTGLDPARFRQAAVVSVLRTPPEWEAGLPWPVRRVDLRRALQPRADVRAYRQLLALMRELRPEVVHAHSSKAGFLARLAAHRLGLPAVYTPHVFPFWAPVGAARRALFLSLERRAVRWTNTVVTLSEGERQEALTRVHYPPERVALIRNGVRLEDYQGGPGRSYRPGLGLPEEAELLVAVGGLRPQKNYPLLLLTVALLADRPRLRCAIAGEGPEEPALRRLAEQLKVTDRVIFLLHREDVPALLSAADVFVMTSLYEGCSYALLEAMAAGTPVVAAPAPGVEEVVGPATGLLAPDRSPAALAACVAQALDDRPAAVARAAVAQTLVGEEFTLDRMLEQIAAVYDQCLRPST